jgi:hypothetical protein
MRRSLSILLLAAFVLPILAPALALAQDADTSLPACCRRHGEHHCGMLSAHSNPSTHHLTAVCAAWPQRAVLSSSATARCGSPSSGCRLALYTAALAPVPFVRPRMAAPVSSHSQRGPPSIFSLS